MLLFVAAGAVAVLEARDRSAVYRFIAHYRLKRRDLIIYLWPTYLSFFLIIVIITIIVTVVIIVILIHRCTSLIPELRLERCCFPSLVQGYELQLDALNLI